MAYTVLWLLLIPAVHAYSSGAPLAVCQNMTPQHHADPQTDPSPFEVKAQPLQVRPGGSVTVTLVSPANKNFKGFFVQGRRSQYNTILGSFTQNTNAQTIDCGDVSNSAATHRSSDNKTTLNIQWTAPNDYQGSVVFRTTFVETGKVFWVDVTPSEELKISGSPIGPVGPLGAPAAPVEPTSMKAPEEDATPFQHLYEGCFDKKGCFGGPDGCIKKRNCRQLVTYFRNDSKFDLEMVGEINGWTGVGFSKDLLMGSDSVTVCSINGSNDRLGVFQAWNTPEKGNAVLQNMFLGLSNTDAKFVDGFVYCKFTHDPVHVINDNLEFNFNNNSYYLFLARGTMGSVNPPIKLNYHRNAPYRSATPASLSDVTELGMVSNALIKLHGSLMTIAWIGTVSVAIFIARYFKQTWTNVVHLKQKVWFTWHRLLNIITLILTVVGFVVIFVHLQGWSQVWRSNPHPILGVITTALVLIQPIMAAFRCHPGTPWRPLFNWAHFLVGNSAQILAVITLFFAKPLPKANLPDFYMWILIAFVAFHVIVFFTMEAFTCVKGKEIRGNQIAMKDMASNGNAYHINEQNLDAPGSRFRKFMLILYLFGNVCFVTAVVATIAVSPVKDR